MNKVKTRMKNGVLIVGLAVVAFFQLPADVQAAATFNNHSQDFQTVQISNHTNNPGCTTCWASSVSADPGDIISVQVYYHNTGPDDAYNTNITLSPKNTSNGTQHTFSGGVNASNASAVNGSATVSINGSQAQSLSYIDGATNWYPDQTGSSKSPTSFPYGQNGSEAFGSGINIGTVEYNPPAGWDTQGVVVFNFKVSDNQPQQSKPSVNTNPASGIGQTSATLNGTIDGNGGSNTQYWFEYGKGTSLNNSTNTKSVSNSGTVSANQTISNLDPGTTYSFRIMGQNSAGTVQGQTLTFTTDQQQTTNLAVDTVGHSSVTTSSAKLSGFVETDGVPTDVKFQYGTSQMFSNQTSTSTFSSGSHGFSKTISGLSPNTTYYYRAYGENNNGLTDTGATKSFTTSSQQQPDPACDDGKDNDGDGLIDYPDDPGCDSPSDDNEYNKQSTTAPDVQTRIATNISENSALIRGEILSIGNNANGVDRYFKWGTSPNGLFNTETLSGTQQYAGIFSTQLTGLSPNTTYYFQACGENSGGTDCGQVRSFTTDDDQQNISQPEVQTRTPSNVSDDAVFLRGKVLDTGDDPSGVDRFFKWGTSINNLNQTLSLSGSQQQIGNFQSYLTGLNEDTIYYYRACVENSVAENCGDVEYFKTQDTDDDVEMPDVRTRSATDIFDSAARLRGEVLDTGDDSGGVDRWFEWGEDDDDLDFVLTLSGTQSFEGNFNRMLSGLDEDTRYYYRACVENSAGEDCGNVETFRTDDDGDHTDDEDEPYVETHNATSITDDTARLNGYIDANGSTTRYRFEYGRSQGLLTFQTSSRHFGLGEDDVDQRITGLEADTRYYFRLRAWNDEGTEYGSIRSFRTDDDGDVVVEEEARPVVITGQASLISQSSARLNGVVLNRGGETLDVFFQWGRSASLGNRTPQQTTQREVATLTYNLFSLQPNTTYNYRVVAQGSSIGTLYGDIVSFRTDSSGNVVTPPATPPEVVVRERGGEGGLPPLVDLNIEADFENVGPNETVTYTLTWKNITGEVQSDGSIDGGTIVTDSVLRTLFPDEVTFNRSSRGSYSETGHALTYEIGTLAPQQEGGMSVQVVGNRGIRSAEPPIVTTANLAFQRPDVRDGNGQLLPNYPDDVIDYVLHNVSGDRTVGVAGLALFSGFFPNSFFGWLLIAIAILLIILIIRYMSRQKEARQTPETTT